MNPHTKFEVSSCIHSRNMEGPQNLKSRSRDVVHAPFDLVLHFWFVGLEINPHTKFEVSGFTHSREIEGVPKCKSGSRDLDHAHFVPEI